MVPKETIGFDPLPFLDARAKIALEATLPGGKNRIEYLSVPTIICLGADPLPSYIGRARGEMRGCLAR